MIEDRIQKIEARINGTENISPETKTELIQLLTALRAEIAALPPTAEEDAHSIARFTEASAHEATRNPKKPELLEAALGGLTGSVDEFEVSHPKLAETLNRIAVILSNMGM